MYFQHLCLLRRKRFFQKKVSIALISAIFFNLAALRLFLGMIRPENLHS